MFNVETPNRAAWPAVVVVVVPMIFTDAISRLGQNRVPEEKRIPLPD
jgi:hypothetical protein